MEIPATYGQANFIFTGADLPTGAEITLGFDHSGSGLTTPVLAAEAIFDAWVAAGMNATYANTVSLVRVDVKFGPNNVGPSGSDSGLSTGQAGGGADSPNTALLVRKNTAFGGRAGRGRFYIPGVPQSYINGDGTLLSTPRANCQTALDAFESELNTRLLPPVLLHAAGSPINSPTPITSFTVDGRVATQRRRLRR